LAGPVLIRTTPVVETMEGAESGSVFDPDAPASEAVLTAVADRAGTEPAELPPLYDAVDVDALDALFGGGKPGRVSFGYAGYEVTVCGRDQVAVICDPGESASGTAASDGDG
jgi:hypothetical protein